MLKRNESVFFPHVWATQIQVIIQDGALKQSRHGDRISHPTKEVNPSQERVSQNEKYRQITEEYDKHTRRRASI